MNSFIVRACEMYFLFSALCLVFHDVDIIILFSGPFSVSRYHNCGNKNRVEFVY